MQRPMEWTVFSFIMRAPRMSGRRVQQEPKTKSIVLVLLVYSSSSNRCPQGRRFNLKMQDSTKRCKYENSVIKNNFRFPSPLMLGYGLITYYYVQYIILLRHSGPL